MELNETLGRLGELFQEAHNRMERANHFDERVPFPIEARSLNYGNDLQRVRGEYNRLVREAESNGQLKASDLEAVGLPARLPD